jgi:hypothetical protein
MEYKATDGVTYYKLSSRKSHTSVVWLIALLLAFGLIATVVGSAFGYAALG